jgi:hypothetical protein
LAVREAEAKNRAEELRQNQDLIKAIVASLQNN